MRCRYGWRSEAGLKNFSVLVSHVLVPPSMTAILQSPGNRVQGFLGPGHVCTVMGYEEYVPIAKHYGVPIVMTGFEPVDMLEGVLWTVRQLEAGTARVENQYSRAVQTQGNLQSRKLIEEVFEICDRKWRGVGIIPKSGFSCDMSIGIMMRSGCLRLGTSRRRNRRSASAGRCCED